MSNITICFILRIKDKMIPINENYNQSEYLNNFTNITEKFINKGLKGEKKKISKSMSLLILSYLVMKNHPYFSNDDFLYQRVSHIQQQSALYEIIGITVEILSKSYNEQDKNETLLKRLEYCHRSTHFNDVLEAHKILGFDIKIINELESTLEILQKNEFEIYYLIALYLFVFRIAVYFYFYHLNNYN